MKQFCMYSVKHFDLAQIQWMAQTHNFPSELIISCDQTGIQLAATSNWTVEECGAERVEIAALGDKQQVTATVAGTLSGELFHYKSYLQGRLKGAISLLLFPVALM